MVEFVQILPTTLELQAQPGSLLGPSVPSRALDQDGVRLGEKEWVGPPGEEV